VLPDVVADFSQVRLEQVAHDRVRVSGARGRAPTQQYKVSATYQDGFRAVAMAVIVGTDAVRKAERTAQALVDRAAMRFDQRKLPGFTRTHVEALGGEAVYLQASRARDSREVVMRLVVEHADAKALDLFARELGSVGLGMAQGTAGLIGGRPKATPVVRLFTFFIGKENLPPIRVQVGDAPAFEQPIPAGVPYDPATPPQPEDVAPDPSWVDVPLGRVAHARSGDKGDSSNIAIYCREPRYLEHLRRVLTPSRVAAHFAGTVVGPVQRFEAPGLNAFNFLLEQALGGGGMASMRIDPQGKAYGQRMLEARVPVPREWGLS
jgi:hypothetical protein